MKFYNPTTPGRRQMTRVDFGVLSKVRPHKRLLRPLKKQAGRNNQGRITVRHQGGGHKKLYRVIDFKQNKFDIPGRVATIEYDPNRSAFIALIVYRDGDKRYILAPKDLKVGDEVMSSAKELSFTVGNRMPFKYIPVGTFVHNVELTPGRGGQLVRSAGSSAQVMGHDKGYTHLAMPSGEVRLVLEEGLASIGALSNQEWGTMVIGKAGRSRWMGIRPTVRGSAMNPRDHPHGGGEGKAPIGLPCPKTKWGKLARGVKTRNRKKHSTKLILKRRK